MLCALRKSIELSTPLASFTYPVFLGSFFAHRRSTDKHDADFSQGATTFALRNGIEAADTLTDDAKKEFEDWRRQHREEAGSDKRGESHDTVGVICLDQDGNLCAGT